MSAYSTDTGSSILKAGDYKLNTLSMTSTQSNVNIDLAGLFSHIEIFEDLFSSTVTAKIHMTDGLNIPEYLPIRGQEKVELEFKTDIDAIQPVKMSFRVYKLDNQDIDQNGKSQKYTIHLISEGGYQNSTHLCGYHLYGSVSSMVCSVFEKHFDSSVWSGKLDLEETKDNYSFVLPRILKPFDAINWLTSKAVNQTGDDYSPFFFFERIDGFTFKSLSTMIESGQSSVIKYFFNTGNLFLDENTQSASPASVGSTVLPARYHKIQDLVELSRFDMVENFRGGKVSSSLLVHDLLRKQTRTVDFREPEVFEKIKKTGTRPHFETTDPFAEELFKRSATLCYSPATPYTAWNSVNNIIDNSNVELLYLKRRFHANSLISGQKVAINVFGDSRRRVGDIVELTVPKIAADSQAYDNTDDKNLSGRYMITAIKHILGKAYTCRFELTKSFMGV